MKTIPQQVLQGLKSIADETVEQSVDNVKAVIGVEKSNKSEHNLFPDIKELSDEQKAVLKRQDEEKKKREMDELRQNMGQGRNVENEMEQVRRQKEEEEKRKEEEFLENLKRQRMAEQQERQRMMVDATPQHKKKKSRGSAFAKGKKPAQDDMSQTGEFSGKKD